MKAPRRPLQPGTKIKFVGPVFWHSKDGSLFTGETALPVVVEKVVDDCIEFEHAIMGRGSIHRRQVTRIILPKPRPSAPKEEEKRDPWKTNELLGELLEKTQNRVQIVYQGTDRAVALWGASKALEFAAPLLSPPGTVPISRKDLERAWAESFGAGNVFKDAMPKLAKALGLGMAEKEQA